MNKELIRQYQTIHDQNKGYGNYFGENRYFENMVEFLLNNNCNKILDFGCGKGALKKQLQKLKFHCVGYDPAVKDFSEFPSDNYDAVVSTDVFEHLDEANMHEEFDLIKSVNPKCLYFNIATGKAGQILPNGLNAHTIVMDESSWKEKLADSFEEYEICDDFTQEKGAPSVIICLKKCRANSGDKNP